MDILAVENCIVNKLKGTFGTTMDVRSWPQDVKEFDNIHAKGAVLVRYLGSDYEDPEANRQKSVHQNRRIQWGVVTVYRGVTGHKNSTGTASVYSHLENIKTSLTGYTVTPVAYSSVLVPLKDNLIEEDQGVFIYETVFEHNIEEYKLYQ